MSSKKICDILNIYSYSQFIQIARALLTRINGCIIDESEIPDDLAEIILKCYNLLDNEKNINEFIDYMKLRINDEDKNSSITKVELEELLLNL